MKKLLSMLLVLVLGISLCSCSRKNVSLDISYSVEGIEKFIKSVCKNVDGEYAEIIEVNKSQSDDLYIAQIDVKLRGKVADSVRIWFNHSGSSDRVNAAGIQFDCFDHQYSGAKDFLLMFECYKEVVIALEETLAGTTYADKYLTSYDEVEELIYSHEVEYSRTITEYQLTDQTKATIDVLLYGSNRGLRYVVKNIGD